MNLISARHPKLKPLFSISKNQKKKIPTNRAGFTLIEVLIALFILALIGATTAKAVVDAAKLREVLRDETEFASEFRTSIAFIERDLNQVFNPRWYLPADFKPLDPYNNTAQVAPAEGSNGTPPPKTLSVEEINRKTRGIAFQPTDYWGPVLDPTGIRASRFQGKIDSFSFLSSSHTRIYQQKKESIYSKIKYELIKQPNNPNLSDEQNAKFSSLRALVKIENTHAFEFEDPKDGHFINNYVILNNIKSIKFSYYKKGEKDTLKEWDSESTDLKWQFPVAIQMEVSISGPKDRTLDEKILFYLETPNDLLPKTY
jgi:prepilin-type N-terminal cleavage/methylation domain-containing protein